MDVFLHSVPQMSRRRHNTILHERLFQGLPLRYFSSSPGLSSAGVAPWHHCHHFLASSQTRQSRPLLFLPRGCTFSMVKTIVVRANCMSDLHFTYWQSVEYCQVVAAGAFTLLGSTFWFSLKGCFSPCFLFLLSCPRVVCSMFPVF